MNDARHKIQGQRRRDSNHEATAQFVDVIFTAAYKGAALIHHHNKTFAFPPVQQDCEQHKRKLEICSTITELRCVVFISAIA